MQRINNASQGSHSLGMNGYPPDQSHSGRNECQASQLPKVPGRRSADWPPLKRAPLTGEPALDRGSSMLMPQVN